MMAYDFLSQTATVYMGIDFCCRDFFMTKHTLDSTEIGPAFQKMGGK